MRRFTLIIGATWVVMLSAAPIPKVVKTMHPLAGTWRLTERINGGESVVSTSITTWDIKDDWVEMKCDGDLVFSGQFDCPDGKGVNAVNYREEMFGASALLKPSTYVGVYELEGDNLLIAFALRGERPTNCSPSEQRDVYRLTRVKSEQNRK